LLIYLFCLCACIREFRYSAWSTDGCNGTNQWGPTPASNLKKVPCKPGGQLELLVSDALHGPKANWKQLPPLFTTNVTKSGMASSPGAITREFVTSGYFGGLSGDPDGGKTRVVTQNNAGPTYWVGKQEPGGQFNAYWDKVRQEVLIVGLPCLALHGMQAGWAAVTK
jgi:hypothetical protein